MAIKKTNISKYNSWLKILSEWKNDNPEQYAQYAKGEKFTKVAGKFWRENGIKNTPLKQIKANLDQIIVSELNNLIAGRNGAIIEIDLLRRDYYHLDEVFALLKSNQKIYIDNSIIRRDSQNPKIKDFEGTVKDIETSKWRSSMLPPLNREVKTLIKRKQISDSPSPSFVPTLLQDGTINFKFEYGYESNVLPKTDQPLTPVKSEPKVIPITQEPKRKFTSQELIDIQKAKKEVEVARKEANESGIKLEEAKQNTEKEKQKTLSDKIKFIKEMKELGYTKKEIDKLLGL